jgi:hypothetical protein
MQLVALKNSPRIRLISAIILPFLITILLTFPPLFGTAYRHLGTRSEAYADELAYGLNLEIALALSHKLQMLDILANIMNRKPHDESLLKLFGDVSKKYPDITQLWLYKNGKTSFSRIKNDVPYYIPQQFSAGKKAALSKISGIDGRDRLLIERFISEQVESGSVGMMLKAENIQCLLDNMLNHGMKSSTILNSKGEVLFLSGPMLKTPAEIQEMLLTITQKGEYTVKYTNRYLGGLVYEINMPLYVAGLEDYLIVSNLYLIEIALAELTSSFMWIAMIMVICSIISISIALVVARDWVNVKSKITRG